MRLLALCVFLLTAAQAFAGEAAVERIRERMAQLGAEVAADAIAATPVAGLYSVETGGDVVYVTADGRYLLHGGLVDLQTGKRLTEAARDDIRVKRLAALGEENMLIFEPRGEPAYQVTVFTDIDCPYCRRLHRHIDELTERGVRVRYVFMPRAGRNSDSYDKAVAVWCADDRRAALSDAKAGRAIERKRCANPVDRSLDLAKELRIRGTPTMIAENGALIRGYRDPDSLIALLQRDAGQGSDIAAAR